MTREEMMNRIEELETARFYLAMKDRWNNEDFQTDDRLYRELRELKQKVKG